MTIRSRILRELHRFHGEWPNSWLGAQDFGRFWRDAAGFAAAIEELVSAGLILKTGGDRPAEAAYRLNPDRIAELRRELAPSLWRVLLLIGFSLIAGVLAFMTMQGL